MALENTFYLNSELRPEETLARLYPDAERPYINNQREYAELVFENWFATASMRVPSGPSFTFQQKKLGIAPLTTISYRHRKTSDVASSQLHHILKALHGLVKNNWDGAFLEGDSMLLFLYKDGKLKVNHYEFWTAERLKQINMPYEVEELPRL